VVKNVPIKTIQFFESPKKSMTRRSSFSSDGKGFSSARKSLKEELLEKAMREDTFESKEVQRGQILGVSGAYIPSSESKKHVKKYASNQLY
jgi:hypothetical protein